jgi:hypothetical protein
MSGKSKEEEKKISDEISFCKLVIRIQEKRRCLSNSNFIREKINAKI